jgi:hypothetical protein
MVDERGVTVYSNVLPENSPKNVEMAVEEKPSDRTPAAAEGSSHPHAAFARSFVSPRFASARVASFHHGGMSRGRR